MTLIFGSIVIIFGFTYSSLLLYLYGGQKLATDYSLTLIRWHCVYILFIALNGVTESFTFAAMDELNLTKFNRKLFALSIFFIISSFLLTKVFSGVGFIMANCLNMSARILQRYVANKFIFKN